MCEIDLRELQLFQLNILKELDRICKKNNIKYFLAYGTCLGAVRHKGFIPWDDDIDVCMLPDDYYRFMEVCKNDLDPKFYFQSHFYNAQTYIFWNRIGVKNSTSINTSMSDIHQEWGICIDIFPLFPVSENAKEQDKRYSWFHKVELLSLKYYHVHGIKEAHGKEKIKKMVHRLIPDSLNRSLFKYYFKKLSSSNETTNVHVTPYLDLERYQYMDLAWFDKPTYLEYENETYPCPSDCDKYLTVLYGDYMQIPKNPVKHSDNPDVLIKFDEPYQKYWK